MDQLFSENQKQYITYQIDKRIVRTILIISSLLFGSLILIFSNYLTKLIAPYIINYTHLVVGGTIFVIGGLLTFIGLLKAIDLFMPPKILNEVPTDPASKEEVKIIKEN